MAVLSYSIETTGIQALESAFARVESRIARLNRVAHGGSTSSRGSSGDRDSGVYATKMARQGDALAKAAERAEKQKTQALERESKKRIRLVEQEARENERIATQQARARKKASDEEARAAKRHAALARQQAAQAQAVGRERYNRLSGAVGGAFSTVRNLGMMGLATAGLGAGALFATAVHSQMGAMAAASKLANQFSENGATVASIRRTKAELLREAGGVQGYTAEETLGAISKYHEKTGEAGSARRMVKRMGGLALASGAEIGDVSEFGSIIHNVLKNKGINGPQAEDMTYDLLKNAAAVAKEKSIELRDFARVGGAVIAQAPMLTGDVATNAKMAMGITQMAIAGGATSPEEAATSFQNMVGDMVKHQKQMRAMGIKDSIKDGKLDLGGTLGQVLEKTGGDIDKAMKVFNIRGLRAFNGLGVMFKTAEEKQKGSGRAAVMGELARLSGATLSEDTIRAGVASRMEDPDMKWKEAQKALSREIGSQLLPVVTKLIPKIGELAPMFGKLAAGMASVIEWLTKNPMTGVASLITGLIIKDIAGAAIGDAIKRAMIGALAGGGGGVAGGAGGPAGVGAAGASGASRTSALGALAAVGTGLAIGVPLAAAIYEGGTNATLDQRKRNKASSDAYNNTIVAGGEFDKPFSLGTDANGNPINAISPEQEAKSKQMGLLRRQAVLKQIADERLQLDAKDGEKSLLGMAEIPYWMPGKEKGDPGQWKGLFDLTGRGARDEQRNVLAERERRALAGDFDKAATDLEKMGYSTENNDQGRGGAGKELGEAGGKLTVAAEALTSAAEKLANAGNNQPPVR